MDREVNGKLFTVVDWVINRLPTVFTEYQRLKCGLPAGTAASGNGNGRI
jgi:hypothetical protein